MPAKLYVSVLEVLRSRCDGEDVVVSDETVGKIGRNVYGIAGYALRLLV